MSFSGDLLGTIKLGNKCGICGPGIINTDNCSEYGNEWSYDSPGPCGACNVLGTFANCKKTRYTGSMEQCCLNKKPDGYPNVTCNPNLNNLAPSCSPIVQSYCSSGDKIFTDPICQQWAANNLNQAFIMKKTYCSPDKIKSDQNCRNWVTSSDVQGKIDDIMVLKYCQTNPKDSLCTCIMSEMTCPNKFDTNCIRQGGYKSSDMMNVTCPNVMNCNQFLGLSPNSQAIATNVQQNCSSTTSSGNQPNNVTNNPTIPNTNIISILLNNNIFLVILILVFLIIIGIIIKLLINNI